jgi:hypothetical protein
MRLFEVEDRFASDLELVLRNMMGRSNTNVNGRGKSTLTLGFPAINNILVNMGYGSVDKDSLQQLIDGNPSLEKIIQTPINDDEIVIKTDTPNSDAPPEEAQKATPKSVDQMAASGAKSALNNPLA